MAKRKSKKLLEKIALWLVLIGALNWGLIGALDFNLVEKIFGTSLFTTIIYVLVGISAIWEGYKKIFK